MTLPFKAVVFDLDGVVTKTAEVHRAAWKRMFDEFLERYAREHNMPFQEFTTDDYLNHVDGKPRYDGVRSFLESRGIFLPEGDPNDPPDALTICGLGNRKNEAFRLVLEQQGVEVYPSTVSLIRALKEAGARVGVASSSKNCRLILEKAGLSDLFETRVDGEVAAQMGLKGKPAPDIFVVAARNLGAEPKVSIVVEDAVSGVQAGANGGFGLVIGLARGNPPEELKNNGADVVLPDFEGVGVDQIAEWFEAKKEGRLR